MPQSLSKVYLHIIFGTKHWQPMIKAPHDEKLYQYLSGVCQNLNSPSLEVNGHLNHVHILCRLAKDVTISGLLEALKTNSSKWMKTQDETLKNFYWQDGYAAFGISEKEVQRVRPYIQNQKEHHTKKNYRAEITSLLKEYSLEYNEKYFWK